MALSFLPDSDLTIEVVVTCDPAVTCSPEQMQAYLEAGDAYTRSELGRILWLDAPSDEREKARWHHELAEDEREALASYQAYLSRVFVEMVRVALVEIDDQPAGDMIDRIKPESHRLQVISELVQHIQRISLLGVSGK
jgi:hypothetical protein